MAYRYAFVAKGAGLQQASAEEGRLLFCGDLEVQGAVQRGGDLGTDASLDEERSRAAAVRSTFCLLPLRWRVCMRALDTLDTLP
jgi:hypothetical protein